MSKRPKEKKNFHKENSPSNHKFNKTNLKELAAQTVELCRSGHYQNLKGENIDILADVQLSVQETKLYLPDFPYLQNLPENPHLSPIIELTYESTISACQRAVNTLGIPETAALIFASARNVCGGFLKGSQAQEEACSYKSSLYISLSSEVCKPYYDYHNTNINAMYSDRIIYTPNNVVFRDNENQFLDQPYKVNFIVSPAVNLGAVQHNQPNEIPNVPKAMIDRIRKIIQIAIINHNRCIILGAYGCGVFHNDPHDVARYFKQILNEEGYAGYFERIIYSVIGPNATHFENELQIPLQEVC